MPDSPKPQAHLAPGALEEALDDDDNALVPLRYPKLREQLWHSLEAQRADIDVLVREQLGVKWCRIAPPTAWRTGSFNVAIPIFLPWRKAAYLRVGLPYRIGESEAPGNEEEKLRCEIATYLWLEENCPDVPIPTLHAFGLPDGSLYTHPSNTPFWPRLFWDVRRWVLSLIGRPVPCRHVRRSARHPLDRGFLLISRAQGKQLALSWYDHCHDASYRENLFRGLSRISLSMNSHPLPRIGSLSLRDDGSVALCSRPLSLYFHMHENEGIPSGIPRHRTYASAEPFISDLLSLQDNKLRFQPNAVHNQDDGRVQMAALTALRATAHHFISPASRNGPFFYTLSDMQQNNIFVDEHWNVQTIIDLEWAHSLPADMQLPPYWLTSRAVDELNTSSALAEYEAMLEEYLAVYAAEEQQRNGSATQAATMRDTWKSRGFWFYKAVTIPKGMYNIFETHVQRLYDAENAQRRAFDDVVFWFWGVGAQRVIDEKIRDGAEYREQVREAFAELAREEVVDESSSEQEDEGRSKEVEEEEEEEE